MFDSGVEWLREAVPAPASLSAAELIDAMVALARVESAVTERKLALIAELADQRIGEQCDAEQVGRWDCDGIEIAESVISAALTTARQHAGTLIALGISLRDRLPHVRSALARGELDVYRATLIEAATRNVTPELIGEVERQVLDKALAPTTPGGTGLTGRRLRNVCTRIVGAMDPAGVRERRRQARHERHVGVSSAEDAMVTLFGSLPAEDGTNSTPAYANSPPRCARTTPAHLPNAGPTRWAPSSTAMPTCPVRAGVRTAPNNPLPTPLGGWCANRWSTSSCWRPPCTEDEEPGYLDGYGLIDAEHARHLADRDDTQPVRVPDDVEMHRSQPNREAEAADTTTAADSAIVDAAPLPESAYTYRPSAVLDTWIRILGGMCQWLHCDAPAWSTDLDHDTPFSHSDPTRGGATTAAGMKPYCRPHHPMKHSGPWAQRRNPDRSIDLLAPTGHHYRTRTGGYLDLLGIDPAQVIDPARVIDPEDTTRRRRTRAQNRAARIRAERRHQQGQTDLAELGRSRSARHDNRPPPGDDPPCPF